MRNQRVRLRCLAVQHRSPLRFQRRSCLASLLVGFFGLLACDLPQASSGNGTTTPPSTQNPDPGPLPAPGSQPPTDSEADRSATGAVAVPDIVVLQPRGEPLRGTDSADADDAAIWIHPQDVSRSLVFVSDKARGVYVFDLHGNEIQHVDFGTRLNNIDVRSTVPWNNGTLHCLAGNLRKVGKLALLRINPAWQAGGSPQHIGRNQPLQVLADASSVGNDISPDSYGFALYRRLSDGALFVFDKSDGHGKVHQWRIEATVSGARTQLVRTIDDVAMARAEGFVADDEYGMVYFAEERRGIHVYRADPEDPLTTRVGLFALGDGIEGDREGLTLYKCADGGGSLILSSQGNSTFKVYDRQTHQHLRTFRATGAHGTDGLDVTSSRVPGFTDGFLVIHDEPGARYLLYDWADLAGGALGACDH